MGREHKTTGPSQLSPLQRSSREDMEGLWLQTVDPGQSHDVVKLQRERERERERESCTQTDAT